MTVDFSQGLFLVLAAALVGGLLAKALKVTPLIGYIISGVIFGSISPVRSLGFDKVAEVGTILLLFSVGIEVSLARLSRVAVVAVFGGLLQMVATATLGFYLFTFFGFAPLAAFILAWGFSVSSTALIVKILSDRGEMDSVHGEVMLGWSLVQDLSTIPILVIITSLGKAPGFSGGNIWELTGRSLITSFVVLVVTIVLGKLVAGRLIHAVAKSESRELLVLSAVVLALGIAALTSALGISPVLGAFLAGLVISETQENHAILAETRPLRDIFVALFFVTLGFFVNLPGILGNIPEILLIFLVVISLKFLIMILISIVFGYRGKIALATALGLAQVGEFSFILFLTAAASGLITNNLASMGIAVAVLSLIASPIAYSFMDTIWKRLKKIIPSGGKVTLGPNPVYENHIIICGYGRVGGWVGKALKEANVPFVVVDYNQRIVSSLKASGEEVIYGDPAEPEVLDSAGVKSARAVVVAIPDKGSRQALIAYVQSVAPSAKIITRVHLDEDWAELKNLKVDKIVQPEFEAAIAIIRSILTLLGKDKKDIDVMTKSLRLSKAAS